MSRHSRLSAIVSQSMLQKFFLSSLIKSEISDPALGLFLLQLNTEWAQVEVINLINDGSGLGFGIIGGRSTGVVVKTILPGGVADRVREIGNSCLSRRGDLNDRSRGIYIIQL